LLPGCRTSESVGVQVNDVHSRLTSTRVREVLRPDRVSELRTVLRRAERRRLGISMAGGRHSMGAQAFGTDSLHLDLTGLRRVGDLDTRAGIVEVEPGIYWPELMAELDRRQAAEDAPWCIVQKQTGADRLTIGGALAANVHGRGLEFAPFIQDVASFNLLTAEGEWIECSRAKHPDWFALAIGGYGLFGVVGSVRLRLMRREIVRRAVKATTIEALPSRLDAALASGALYGDFQFSTATETEGFLRDGVFSTYHPVPAGSFRSEDLTPAGKQVLSTEQWSRLITLAHSDRDRAFRSYLDYYRTTDGQLYESDRQQLSTYLPDYHEVVARALRPAVPQSLVITELYVPRERLVEFFDRVRAELRTHEVDLVYGVVRWIEADVESFLPWAKDSFACVIFNLNVKHSAEGRAKAARDFRRLIDCSLDFGGSYYLTYHRHATREQVESAYPNFRYMLEEKERRDPAGRWTSDWHRHYRALFEG